MLTGVLPRFDEAAVLSVALGEHNSLVVPIVEVSRGSLAASRLWRGPVSSTLYMLLESSAFVSGLPYGALSMYIARLLYSSCSELSMPLQLHPLPPCSTIAYLGRS